MSIFQPFLSGFFLFSNSLSSSLYFWVSLPLFMPSLHCLHSSLFSSLRESALPHLYHSVLSLRLVLLCVFSFTHPLCSRHMFSFIAPHRPAAGCTALCWQMAALSDTAYNTATLGRTASPLQWAGSQYGTAYPQQFWSTVFYTQEHRYCIMTYLIFHTWLKKQLHFKNWHSTFKMFYQVMLSPVGGG